MVLNAHNASISSENLPFQEARDILFPHHSEDVGVQIALDIGGSLAKVVWFSKKAGEPGGRLNFTKFETVNIKACIAFIKEIIAATDGVAGTGRLDSPGRRGKKVVIATGGGAHKYADWIKEELQVELQKEDEMECLISGLNFLVRQVAHEVFTYDERLDGNHVQYEETPTDFYPYLLVNIGSGVSIVKVTDENTHERISGTSLGGGTLWGLLSLLTNAKNYDQMLELSSRGENRNVDMLVGDIYGTDYNKIGLKATTIASSFGKVFKMSPEERTELKEEDIARSLLYLVSNNIGQIAYLNARAHGLTRIYFSGFFIRGHPATMNTLNFAIHFWSKGLIRALFLRHEGYLGAVGAFISQRPAQNRRLVSFQESFITAQKISPLSISAVGVLNEAPSSLTAFPLLANAEEYNPNTLRLADASSQHYWIDLLDRNLEKLTHLAIEWEKERSEDAVERANAFKNMYRQHLQQLRREPNSYGPFSVSALLDLREQCLQEMSFNDIFKSIKDSENEAALRLLPALLVRLDAMVDGDALLDVLLENVLAGNMYDWGSSSMVELLQNGEMNFDRAREKVGKSQYDSRGGFKDRALKGPRFMKAVVFVDNSGADVLMGIVPFVRYLLGKGTHVILAANSTPCVNDVTAEELDVLLSRVCSFDEPIRNASATGQLCVMASGSGSPCINLKYIDVNLALESQTADLVVLEGMGRSIHTNFHAKFRVPSLKIATFKNEYVAKALGAQMYDGIVVFSNGSE